MDATGFGYKMGVIPRMPVSVFEADRKLIDAARAACSEAVPEIGVFEGRVVSGDQFITDKDTKKRLVETFAAYCTEMEGAAIAQAAYLNNIPFLIIRAISDKAVTVLPWTMVSLSARQSNIPFLLMENLIRRI